MDIIANRIGLYEEEIFKFINMSKDVLFSGQLSDGKHTKRLERTFPDSSKSRAIVTNSGTSALYLTLLMLKREYGYKNVILPRYTVPMVLDVCRLLGYNMFEVDTSDDFLMSVGDVHDVLENKVDGATIILFVLTGGIVNSKIELLRDLAIKYRSKFLVDGSHAHGCVYKGRSIEEYADIVVYSMYATKVLTMGEGGIIVLTENEKDSFNAEAVLKLLRNQGKAQVSGQLLNIGYGNHRASELQSLMGCIEVHYREDIYAHRRMIASLYAEYGIKSLQDEDEKADSTYYKYTVKMENNEVEFLTEKFIVNKIQPSGLTYHVSSFRRNVHLTTGEYELAINHINLPLDRFLDVDKITEVIRIYKEAIK